MGMLASAAPCPGSANAGYVDSWSSIASYNLRSVPNIRHILRRYPRASDMAKVADAKKEQTAKK